MKVGKALAEAFHKHGAAKPSLVRAFLTDSGAMATFDPSSPSFEEHVSDTVAETLQRNPELRAQNIAQRSGGDFRGGVPSSKQITRQELAAMTPDEINRARQAGLLNDVLGRQR